MEEREIDLLDMIADILSHWKGLLVALIVGAVLMGGFSYVKSYREAQNAQPIVEEETDDVVDKKLEQLEEDLDDSQKAAVLTTIEDEKEYAAKKKYTEESVYMQLDPFQVTQIQLSYQIEPGEDSRTLGLGAAYNAVIDNIGLYDWIEKETGIASAYAKELIWVQTSSTTPFTNGEDVGMFGTDSITIKIMQADEKSCKKIADAVKSYVEKQKELLEEEVGTHELVLLSETAGTMMNSDLLNRQIDYGNDITGMRSTIATSKAGFDEDQVQYYNLLTKKEGHDKLLVEKEETQEDTDAEQPQIAVTPSVSIKYVLLGAVLFAFVYAGVLFLIYIFNTKIRVSDELQTLYHIPQIGTVVKDSGKKFIVDKWVDGLRHYGKRKFSAEQSMELAFAAVKIAAAKNELSNICLMGCNLGAGVGTVCEGLKAALEKEGIAVTVLDNVLYNAEAMEKVDAMTGVVLVEKAGSTLYNEIASELALLKRQEIAVLGGIIVE